MELSGCMVKKLEEEFQAILANEDQEASEKPELALIGLIDKMKRRGLAYHLVYSVPDPSNRALVGQIRSALDYCKTQIRTRSDSRCMLISAVAAAVAAIVAMITTIVSLARA